MGKLTKRIIEALDAKGGPDIFEWDSELRGFGVRARATGSKTYLVQYRNTEGRTRRLVLGKHGALTVHQARDLARQKLAAVARGEDPSEERRAMRNGLTVGELCDWYLEHARSGRILGRRRRPIKPATLDMDQSRIDTHIRPLLGSRSIKGLTALKVRRKRRARRGPPSGERQALIQAIAELPPEARDVFLLHRMAGLRYDEIGLHLNMSPVAVQAPVLLRCRSQAQLSDRGPT